MSGAKGFTLIELLVSISLLAVISLAVYGSLAGGIKLSKRLLSERVSIDLTLDWKRLQKDLRSHLTYRSIPFLGAENELSFPSLIPVQKAGEGRAPHNEVGRIRYYHNDSSGKLCRETTNFVGISEGGKGTCQPIFKSISDSSFEYFGQSTKGQGPGFWSSTWDKDFPPLAVRLKAETENGIKKTFTTLLP